MYSSVRNLGGLFCLPFVFLKMFCRISGGHNIDWPEAAAASAWSRSIDRPIVLGRGGTKPIGMSGRCAAILGERLRNWFGRRLRIDLFLIVGGELVLPFEIELQLDLREFDPAVFVFFGKLAIALTLTIDRAVQVSTSPFLP